MPRIKSTIQSGPVIRSTITLTGAVGPQGPVGPNQVSESTTTNLQGVLVADGNKIREALPGEVVDSSALQSATSPIISAVETLDSTKASKSEVASSLALKADASDVTAALATKAESAEVSLALSVKADVSTVSMIASQVTSIANAQASGRIAYLSYSDMIADATQYVGTIAEVGGSETDITLRGVYQWDGVNWIKDANSLEPRVTSVEQSLEEQFKLLAVPDITPLIVDSNGDTVLGVDQFGIKMIAPVNYETQEQLGVLQYTGSGEVVPIEVDAYFNILSGFNRSTGEFESIVKNYDVALKANWKPLLNPPRKAEVNQIGSTGQSLSQGVLSNPPISTSQPFSNLTFEGGPRSSLAGSIGDNPGMGSIVPLVENNLAYDFEPNTSGESPCSFIANYASILFAENNGIVPRDFVTFASCWGRRGYRIDQIEEGTAWFRMPQDHITEAHRLSGGKTQLQAIFFVQGESDAREDYMTDREVYKTKLLKYREDLEGIANRVQGNKRKVHMIVYQTVHEIRNYSGIALAQLDACRESPYMHLGTPIYHLPHVSDATHLSNVGSARLGAYFGRAYYYLMLGVEPPSIRFKSAIAKGMSVTVHCDVPTMPLVLDTANLASTTDYGFAVEDEDGIIDIQSISVSGSSVTIELGREIEGDAVVRYAIDYLGSGLNITAGASGNLRDSSTETVEITGNTYPLWHVAPHVELDVIKI